MSGALVRGRRGDVSWFCFKFAVGKNTLLFEEREIMLRIFAALCRPAIEIFQFYAQDRCLQCVEPKVPANLLVIIFDLASMHAKHFERRVEAFRPAGHKPAISERSKILRRKKTE